MEQTRAEQERSESLAQHHFSSGNAFTGKRSLFETPVDELVTEINIADELDEAGGKLNHLEHGDFVELITGARHIPAIFIRKFRTQSQFYTMDGRWLHRLESKSVSFAIRRFFEPEEVRSILPYLPETEIPETAVDEMFPMLHNVPRGLAAPLVSKMLKFQHEADEIYRHHAASIDSAYDQIAHANRFHHLWITLEEIASKVLDLPIQQISQPALWAVHRRIIRREIGLIPNFNRHWVRSEFGIRSAQEVELLKRVQSWFHEYLDHSVENSSKVIEISENQSVARAKSTHRESSTVIGDFIKRVRSIISESRKYRKVVSIGGIGPTLIQAKPVKTFYAERSVATKSIKIGDFTDNESAILRYFELWSLRATVSPTSPLFVIGSRILGAIGLYDGFELNTSTGFTMLQEVGCITPWENRTVFRPKLALPGLQPDPATEKLVMNAAEASKVFKLVDRMAEYRHDWGDLEVFCVDRLEAHEIDDGISVEPVVGDDSCFWIHSHIANPTAFIPPDSDISKYAAQLVESVYLPEKTFFMLAPKVTRKHFSLDKDRPVLTFSAKVNLDGEILESKITPGTIRNVTFMTEDTLHEVLRSKDLATPEVLSYAVGHNAPPDPVASRSVVTHDKLDPIQIDKLQTLLRLSRATRIARERKDAVSLPPQSADVQVYYTEPGLPYRRIVRRIEGDPTITLQTKGFIIEDTPEVSHFRDVEAVVANIMVIAGSIAGNWCAHRNIPAIFRGNSPNPTLPSPGAMKAELLSKKGSLSWQDKYDFVYCFGGGIVSTNPMRHQSLGFDAYCKVTSPLRRYGDMVNHWQIEAAIREEAASRATVDATKSDKFLTFTKDEVKKIIPQLARGEHEISYVKRSSHTFWIMTMLHRHFYHGENMGLPEVLEVYITEYEPLTENCRGMVRELSIWCEVVLVENPDASKILAPAQWWTATIDSVDTYRRTVRVKLIALKEG